MRGRQKLFDDSISEDCVRQGRSAKLHSDRNKALVYRYYHYQCHTQLRFGAILERLSMEFYISTFTVQKSIDEQFSLLNDLKKQRPTTSDLRKLYPYLNWT
jgi:hypothetical protein